MATTGEQGALVAAMYRQASGVLCERQAVLAGGLPRVDKAEALARAGIDPAGYLTISIDQILTEMADTGCLADQTATSIAPDEIFRPYRLAIGQLNVDAGVVLREPPNGALLGRCVPEHLS